MHPIVARFISETQQNLAAHKEELGRIKDALAAAEQNAVGTADGLARIIRDELMPRLAALEAGAKQDVEALYEALKARIHSPIR